MTQVEGPRSACVRLLRTRVQLQHACAAAAGARGGGSRCCRSPGSLFARSRREAQVSACSAMNSMAKGRPQMGQGTPAELRAVETRDPSRPIEFRLVQPARLPRLAEPTEAGSGGGHFQRTTRSVVFCRWPAAIGEPRSTGQRSGGREVVAGRHRQGRTSGACRRARSPRLLHSDFCARDRLPQL